MTESQKDRKPDEIRTEIDSLEMGVLALRHELRVALERELAGGLAAGRGNHHGYWREDGSCSQCGSMTTGEAVSRLRTPGTHYSGSDWKYGYPHKFYIAHSRYPGKFYTAHLEDATPEEFLEFARLSAALFGIDWQKGSEGDHDLLWSAPTGTQKDGVVE